MIVCFRLFFLLTLGFSFFAMNFVFGQSKVEFPQETISLGQIHNSAAIPVRIPVSNKGKSPLLIQIKRQSCGCLSSEVNQDITIQPGKSHIFSMTVNTTNKSGVMSLWVEFQTNDPENLSKIIQITGTIKDSFVLNPSIINESPAYGEFFKCELNLQSISHECIPTDIIATSSSLITELIPKDSNENKNWRLIVKSKEPVLNDIFGYVELKYICGDEKDLKLNIPIQIVVQKPVLLYPSSLLIKKDDAGTSIHLKLIVPANKKYSPKFLEAEISEQLRNNLSVRVVEPQHAGSSSSGLILWVDSIQPSSTFTGGSLSFDFVLLPSNLKYRTNINVLLK